MKPARSAAGNEPQPQTQEVKKHYQLYRRDNDHFDMVLKDPMTEVTQIYFHIARAATAKAHLLLHAGDSTSSPVYAAAVFRGFAKGYLHAGEPVTSAPEAAPGEDDGQSPPAATDEWWADPSAWTGWDEGELLAAPYSECRVDDLTTIRWHRSTISQRRSSISLTTQKRLVWRLTRHNIHKTAKRQKMPVAATSGGFSGGVFKEGPTTPGLEALDGPVLATLTSELPTTRLKVGKTGREVETGNLHWFENVDEKTEKLATMLIMLLWHRNRQINRQEPLGPTVAVSDPRMKTGGGVVVFGAGLINAEVVARHAVKQGRQL